MGQYPGEMVYVVREVHTPAEVMELTLYPGDHVALLKNKDPLGRTDRWFVDDGGEAPKGRCLISALVNFFFSVVALCFMDGDMPVMLFYVSFHATHCCGILFIIVLVYYFIFLLLIHLYATLN